MSKTGCSEQLSLFSVGKQDTGRTEYRAGADGQDRDRQGRRGTGQAGRRTVASERPAGLEFASVLFLGVAPDWGAHELGKPEPCCGPESAFPRNL